MARMNDVGVFISSVLSSISLTFLSVLVKQQYFAVIVTLYTQSDFIDGIFLFTGT